MTERPSSWRWARGPREFLRTNQRLFTGTTVLEVGGSDGPNLLWLARIGYTVFNLDEDSRALEDFRRRAERGKVSQNTVGIEMDLNIARLPTDLCFDNILCFYVLHFLEASKARQVVEDMKQMSTPGGVNLLALFTNNGDFENLLGTYLPSRGEALALYGADDEWFIHEARINTIRTKSRKKQEQILIAAIKKV